LIYQAQPRCAATGHGERADRRDVRTALSNLGKWDDWYKGLQPGQENIALYGEALTYRMAAAFLADAKDVEDWGCGKGGFRLFCQGRYKGVDGSHTPYADQIADLCTYRSSPEGILLRHVLEHNYDWEKILHSAIQSFRKKLCIVLFTPFATGATTEIAHNRHLGVDVPDLSLSQAEIERHLHGLRWRLFKDLATKSQYKVEHVYCVWREPKRFWSLGRVSGR
jgi:hypothetical protein